ncbi:MAG: hypothetical protein WDN44_02505 [Sphingomonas sp.]
MTRPVSPEEHASLVRRMIGALRQMAARGARPWHQGDRRDDPAPTADRPITIRTLPMRPIAPRSTPGSARPAISTVVIDFDAVTRDPSQPNRPARRL